MPEAQTHTDQSESVIDRAAALEAIQNLRHAVACSFAPENSGALGEARCNSLYEACEAVRKMPGAPSPAPRAPAVPGLGELRAKATALLTDYRALETVLASMDADIPDGATVWVKAGNQRQEIATYGQFRDLYRTLLDTAPAAPAVEGGEREGMAREWLRDALTSSPAPAGEGDLRPDWLDFAPNLGAPTPEPSIRELVSFYYRRFPDLIAGGNADSLIQDYLAALTRPPARAVDVPAERERIIEAAAEAIWDAYRAAQGSITISCTPWSRLAEDAREKYRANARAAVDVFTPRLLDQASNELRKRDELMAPREDIAWTILCNVRTDITEGRMRELLASEDRMPFSRPWHQRWEVARRQADAILASRTTETGGARGKSQAAIDVLAERCRQVEAEGWTPEHDDEHAKCELAQAAACYALAPSPVGIEREWIYPNAPKGWPWHLSWWKPGFYRRNLVKACALLLAEIERWDRLAARPATPSTAEGAR